MFKVNLKKYFQLLTLICTPALLLGFFTRLKAKHTGWTFVLFFYARYVLRIEIFYTYKNKQKLKKKKIHFNLILVNKTVVVGMTLHLLLYRLWCFPKVKSTYFNQFLYRQKSIIDIKRSINTREYVTSKASLFTYQLSYIFFYFHHLIICFVICSV